MFQPDSHTDVHYAAFPIDEKGTRLLLEFSFDNTSTLTTTGEILSINPAPHVRMYEKQVDAAKRECGDAKILHELNLDSVDSQNLERDIRRAMRAFLQKQGLESELESPYSRAEALKVTGGKDKEARRALSAIAELENNPETFLPLLDEASKSRTIAFTKANSLLGKTISIGDLQQATVDRRADLILGLLNKGVAAVDPASQFPRTFEPTISRTFFDGDPVGMVHDLVLSKMVLSAGQEAS